MGIYNRLRVLVLDNGLKIRDSEDARAKYDAFFEPLGGSYSGYQSHHYNGPRPAHFYLIDDPTDEVIADLLVKTEREGMPFRLFREYKGQANCEVSLDGIVRDVAKVLERDFIEHESAMSDSNVVARCWNGVKVLALAAGKRA